MKKRFRYILLLIALCAIDCAAQNFDEYFTDRTLRIDYIFAGNAQQQDISVDELCVEPRWWGKRKRLTEVPMDGNGQIIVKDHATGNTIYRNSFSTLFQEWLTYPEAETTRKSFENVFLVPMPQKTADVTVELYDNRRQVKTRMTHTVNPADILIRHTGYEHVTPYETLQQPADTAHAIRIAYIAEGYQAAEMPQFIKDARAAMEAMFAHEPFKTLRNRFHIVAVKAPSVDSGTSEPSKGIWKNTALHSHFDTFYSSRYLTTLHLKDLHEWLAGTPYEHIIVLVNTATYGGGGILNSYNLTAAHHPSTLPVVVHEFGHSFAGLADEYAYEAEAIPMYPHDIEPWEANITTLKDFQAKWADMIGKRTKIPTPLNPKQMDKPGVYEGAGYSLKGVYRAYQDCRMRTNEHPEFCPVCRRQIERVIRFYTE
ncbi:M64 family metallopeptidase [Prevotella sp.]|uniref:M64 family metallopeptidase n=1 Tax=Prevotella sp. TaxID=59823 RepID=UPI002F949317